jgi:ubiquitin C-terminal hydrolase
MAESFQRSAEIGFGSESKRQRSGCLGDLLPSVFGGTVNYVTRCCKCGFESTRSEDFMELSIPIVVDRCTEVESSERKSTGGGSKKTSKAEKKTSAAGGDVDVQQCVDAYLHPESLEGDNKYECSKCKKKCDATRSMTMVKLPPVLNIQLARYVFDR